jgi:hypothetical protein
MDIDTEQYQADRRAEVFVEVEAEMAEAVRQGYDQKHDDEHRSGHLQVEAVRRLTHMGEYPTDAFVRHELIVAIGLLTNAVLTLDRSLDSGHTFSTEGAI